MNTTKTNRWPLRMASALMGLLMTVGLFAGLAVDVNAAEGEAMVPISGGVQYDLENPPPLPEGVIPPQLGLDEVFMENDGGITEIELAKLLVESAIGWAAGKGLDFGSDKLLAAIFGTKENQQMDEVIAKQNQIIDLLNQMLNLIKSLDYKQSINEKTRKVNTMWEKYLNKSGAVADKNLSAQQRKDKLKEYFNGSGDNYVLQVIDLYVNYLEGKGMMNGNIFSTYDAYALHNYWWEHQGYDFRTSVRVLDTAQFMQMWTLAYAVCEAHVQDNTPYAAEAKEAQLRLKQCLAPQQGAKNDLLGLKQLMEKWPVNHLNKHCYTFQVPGRSQKYYIPQQTEVSNRKSRIYDSKYQNVRAYDVLREIFFRIPDAENPKLTHEITDYYATLEPVKNYYASSGDKRSLRDILYSVTEDETFQYNQNGYEKASFLQKRDFISHPVSDLKNDYGYFAYIVEPDPRHRTAAEFWLGAHEANAHIRKVLDYHDNAWFTIYEQSTIPTVELDGTNTKTDTIEVTDSGVISAVEDGHLILTVDLANVTTPVTEKVFISPATMMADGSPLGMENLQGFLNNAVEISGTYNFENGTLDAKTITVKDSSGVQEVSGTVVSSIANAVMVLEDGTGITNGYFLPDVKEDVPEGSRITLRYHWENGVKTVDGYELQDGPAPTPVPEPVPEPQPDPVDGPVSSMPLPQASNS